MIGYVNVKEMLFLATDTTPDAETPLPLRSIITVSEDDSAADVMSSLVRERMHIAIVTSKDGKTTGLVTLEDVVEELLGDIRDEFDGLPRHIRRTGDDRWTVGGGVHLGPLCHELGISTASLEGEPDQPLSVWLEARIDGSVPSRRDAHCGGPTLCCRKTSARESLRMQDPAE